MRTDRSDQRAQNTWIHHRSACTCSVRCRPCRSRHQQTFLNRKTAILVNLVRINVLFRFVAELSFHLSKTRGKVIDGLHLAKDSRKFTFQKMGRKFGPLWIDQFKRTMRSWKHGQLHNSGEPEKFIDFEIYCLYILVFKKTIKSLEISEWYGWNI